MNAVLQHMVDELGIDQAEAERLLEPYEAVPIMSGETVIGHVAKSGSEIHTVLFPEYRDSLHARSVIRLYRKLLQASKFLVTRVPYGHAKEQDITERVGFVETRRDKDFIYYWLDSSTLIGGRKHATSSL